jgi:hypothetical protein
MENQGTGTGLTLYRWEECGITFTKRQLQRCIQGYI